jgi:hypothetical protein
VVKKKNGGSETLTGVVTAINWDGDQVSEVALFATDDEAYHIENSHKFLSLLQKSIEASGHVQRNKKKFRTINIKKYKLL